MTMSFIAQVCNANLIGFLSLTVVIETLILIIQQVIIHKKGVIPQ